MCPHPLSSALPPNPVLPWAANPAFRIRRAGKRGLAPGMQGPRLGMGRWIVALAALWVVASVAAQGATWQTIDAPARVEYLDIATGQDGEVYAAGDYFPESGPSQAVLRRSRDGGQTWDIMAMPP